MQIDQSLQLLESPFTTHLLATRSPGAGDWKESQSATEPFYELCADASAEPRGLQIGRLLILQMHQKLDVSFEKFSG